MSDFDQELSRTLHRQAGTMPAGPLSFDDVRGRATSIRRRRRLAGAVGAVAAAAVIVPTALFAAKGPHADGPSPATQSPTPTAVDTNSASPTATPTVTPTSTPVMGADPHALDVRELPTGAPPRIGYLMTDDESPLPFVYVRTGEATASIDSQGLTVERDGAGSGYSGVSGVARNAEGTIAAWVTEGGSVTVWQDGQSDDLELGTVDLHGAVVEAVTGNDCTVAHSCFVWIRGTDPAAHEAPTSVVMGTDGSVEPADAGRDITLVRDAAENGLILGTTSIGEGSSCSSVVFTDQPGTPTVFSTCKHTLDEFSQSTRYVLASDDFHSGNLNGAIAVYDVQTGKPRTFRVASTQDSAFYGQAVWEDDTHVLFTAYQDKQWSIVRMDVDGAMEYAVPPVSEGDELHPPFVLESR
jgi:hypothetical protein